LQQVSQCIERVRQMFLRLGLTENLDKFVAPTQQLVILGVAFDLHTMTVGIVPERAKLLQAQIDAMLQMDKASKPTLADVQSLCGRLTFVGVIHPFARAHTGPLWNLTAGRTNAAAHVHISAAARRCLYWWKDLLSSGALLRGFSSLLLALSPERTLHIIAGLSTDSSGSGWGAASTLHRIAMRGLWTIGATQFSINVTECAAVLFITSALAPLLAGRVVVCEIDNVATICAITKQSSACADLASIASALCEIQQAYGFFIVPKYLPSAANLIADSLSRGRRWAECLPDQGRDWQKWPMRQQADSPGILARWQSLSVPSPEAQLQLFPLASDTSTRFDYSASASSTQERSTSLDFPWVPYMTSKAVFTRAPAVASE